MNFLKSSLRISKSAQRMYSTKHSQYLVKLLDLDLKTDFIPRHSIFSTIERRYDENKIQSFLDTTTRHGWELKNIIPLTYDTLAEGRDPYCTKLLIILQKSDSK
jgi:hypothetical protein